ncbi:hypothetical protein HAX54_009525 [Datura stramonium]|uniref:Reverse transcriptase zinc-binding domain-containing protein n=1 Tax=Datura stramonium TaxID=4076 RepID=A0ABS8RW79_DATST|nr:hypothetical protein [Datura stramonium]
MGTAHTPNGRYSISPMVGCSGRETPLGMELCGMGIAHDSTDCCLCEQGLFETAAHLFHDCPWAKEVWKAVVESEFSPRISK